MIKIVGEGVWKSEISIDMNIGYCSGPNDHVFVNFVDHGAPGLVAFPDSELHAKPFIKALKSMHENEKYAQVIKAPLISMVLDILLNAIIFRLNILSYFFPIIISVASYSTVCVNGIFSLASHSLSQL